MRFGTVAIVGRTNVGKSTFLNACLGEKLAIVSPLPQTTRDDLLGVVHRPDAQIAFTDTPGLHRPKNELGRRMNAKALDTLRNHDVAVFMTDVLSLQTKKPAQGEYDPIHPDDRRLLQMLHPDVPCVLVLNKTDLIKDKSQLLPLLVALNEAREFAALIPISVLEGDGVDRVLDEIVRHLPEAPAVYPTDTLTNRPVSFFAREYIREQVLLQTRSEVPHATAVSIDKYEDGKTLCRITATIHVEKVGQRSILVGKGGERIKELGTQARLEIERLVGKRVHLELFVRISERWKDMPRQLQELGYDAGSGGRSLVSALPASSEPKRKPARKPPVERPVGRFRRGAQGSAQPLNAASKSAASKSAASKSAAAATKPNLSAKTGSKPAAPASAKPAADPRLASASKPARGGKKPFARSQVKKVTRKRTAPPRSRKP
jgi:GTPase